MNGKSFLGFQRGFGLVEVIVGLVLGMIGSLVVLQVYSVSEGYKRTSTGSGDAQQNGALALFAIERDVRRGGYGMTDIYGLDCKVQAYDELRVGVKTFELKFSGPVVITQGAGGAPDSFTVTYASSGLIPNPAALGKAYNGTSAEFKVSQRYGFQEGDMMVAYQPGKDCSLYEVTNVPGGGLSDQIIHNSGTYENADGIRVPARFNPPGGIGIAYDAKEAVIYNLGSLPQSRTYSVSANRRLTVDDAFDTQPTMEVADEVVNLQAQYGKDTSATPDGVVDLWDEVTPTTPDAWSRVLAVRVAVLSRSNLREKDEVTATPGIELWPGGPSHAIDAEARHFRYRTYETVVALRSMIWRP